MNLAINGFGRIGRLFFRQMFAMPGFDIVAVNDLGDIENLAYLLMHDSVYRNFDHAVSVDKAKNTINVDGKTIQFVHEKEANNLPWSAHKIDIAVEATGFYTSFEQARAHIKAGARRVVITAPAKDEERSDARTVLNGVNEELFESCVVTSNGSCTTNSASPIISILSEKPGIEKAMLTTIHGYTSTQKLIDGADSKDWRRGRTAAQNIIPTETGAAISVGRAIESIQGKFDGIAIRVPVSVGSLSDITFIARHQTNKEEINEILMEAAETPKWKDIFAVTNEKLVSSDIIESPYGAIADLSLTKVIDGNLVKVLSWYDNEYGYVKTLVEHVKKVAQTLE